MAAPGEDLAEADRREGATATAYAARRATVAPTQAARLAAQRVAACLLDAPLRDRLRIHSDRAFAAATAGDWGEDNPSLAIDVILASAKYGILAECRPEGGATPSASPPRPLVSPAAAPSALGSPPASPSPCLGDPAAIAQLREAASVGMGAGIALAVSGHDPTIGAEMVDLATRLLRRADELTQACAGGSPPATPATPGG